MIVIADHATPKDQYAKEIVVKTAEGIEQDIKELLRCDLRMGSLMASDDITAYLGQLKRI